MTGAQASELAFSEPPRPRRRNPLTRLTAAHLLMVLAAVLAFATNLMVLRGQEKTREAVIASGRIEAGRVIAPTDLTVAEVDVDDGLFATLLSGQQSQALVGMVATRTIEAGHLLSVDDLRPPAAPSAQRAISIPIEIEHAVGGGLVAGDRIDLIAVADGGPQYVLVGAEVLEVPSTARGSLTGATGFFVVVAVDDQQALAVAAAIRSGEIEIARSTGSSPAVRQP
ncbi:MAG TPA: SAF domain-containing protein [Acidimicrobiia bacterium]|nr:SAF domain-containing protein [Acidimicrobiia bacterium]